MEIKRLHEMLTEAGIPHEWVNRNTYMGVLEKTSVDWGYQVVVYDDEGNRVVSAVEGYGTYGYKADSIEIMGLTENGDTVEGWLTAEEVFGRIQRWYSKS